MYWKLPNKNKVQHDVIVYQESRTGDAFTPTDLEKTEWEEPFIGLFDCNDSDEIILETLKPMGPMFFVAAQRLGMFRKLGQQSRIGNLRDNFGEDIVCNPGKSHITFSRDTMEKVANFLLDTYDWRVYSEEDDCVVSNEDDDIMLDDSE